MPRLWTNDKGEHIQFSFADMKRYTDMTASYFQSLGIGHGDMVMLILKRRYEFWFSIIALHKLGAVVIPATHLLTKKDIVYRCNAADIKMIVCAGESVITDHITAAMPDSPSVKKLVSVGPEIAEGFEDFHKGIADATPFARTEHPNSNDDISLMYFTSGTTGEPKMVAHDFTYPLGHIVPEVSGTTCTKTVCTSPLPIRRGSTLLRQWCNTAMKRGRTSSGLRESGTGRW